MAMSVASSSWALSSLTVASLSGGLTVFGRGRVLVAALGPKQTTDWGGSLSVPWNVEDCRSASGEAGEVNWKATGANMRGGDHVVTHRPIPALWAAEVSVQRSDRAVTDEAPVAISSSAEVIPTRFIGVDGPIHADPQIFSQGAKT